MPLPYGGECLYIYRPGASTDFGAICFVLTYLLTYLYIINDSDKQEHNVRSQFLRVVQLEDYYFIIVSVRELVN